MIEFATELSRALCCVYVVYCAAGVLGAFFFFFFFSLLLRFEVLDYVWVSKKKQAKMNADLLRNAMIDNVSALVSPLWKEATGLVFCVL